MPATPIRHRALASIAGVVLGLGLLAGCAGQQTPDEYSDKVERNFVAGCTRTATGDDAELTATEAEDYCGCVYEALSGEDGVDFGEFKQVNEDQTEDPGPLPDSFTKAYEDCEPLGGGAAAGGASDDVDRDGDSSSSTTEAGDTTTTEG